MENEGVYEEKIYLLMACTSLVSMLTTKSHERARRSEFVVNLLKIGLKDHELTKIKLG